MNFNIKILKKYSVFCGIAIAFSFAGSAVAYPVTVKLLADAEWLPEGSGVLLSTDKGYVHIYNENMDKLGDSKKGECYILEADTEDYVTLHKKKFPSLKALDSQREVSSWTKVNCKPVVAKASTPDFSATDFTQLERWKAEIKGEEYMADSFDKVIAETAKHFVVYQNAGTSCAAGNHWLFNKQNKSYRPIDAGTCDDRKFEVILESQKLIFMSGKKITAQYPIY